MKKAQNSVDPDKDSFDYDLLPGLIGYNLRRAQTAVFQDFSESLKACDITPGQFGVLILIQANSGLNQTRLGNALGIDRSTVVAVIDRLEGRGLVLRGPVIGDPMPCGYRIRDNPCWPRPEPKWRSMKSVSPTAWIWRSRNS